MRLNEKQRKFVDEYLRTGNAMQSAITAGYSDNYAKAQSSKLLENVGIKSYLTERRKEIESNRIMSAQQALELLTKIAKGEEKETVIVSSPDGVYQSKKEADLKTRIAAVKEILKRYPAENPLTQAQIRKLKAEADIKEAEAKSIGDTDNGGITVEIVRTDSRGQSDETKS